MPISIHMSELQAAGFSSIQEFSRLYVPQRRRIIASILRSRGDAESINIAYMIERNNPNFQAIQIVH